MGQERNLEVAEYYRHHHNAADHIEEAVRELTEADKYLAVNSWTMDDLRRALFQINLELGRS